MDSPTFQLSLNLTAPGSVLCKFCGAPVVFLNGRDWYGDPTGHTRRTPINPDNTIHRCAERYGHERIIPPSTLLAPSTKRFEDFVHLDWQTKYDSNF